MNVFSKSNNNDISNSTISSVAGDQNVAENMTIVHQGERRLDSRKRGRQMSDDSDANSKSPSIEVIQLADEFNAIQNIDTPSARSKSTRPPAKKSRADDDDRARDGTTHTSEPVHNLIGRDSYTAGTLQIFPQRWDDTGARQNFRQELLPIVPPPSPVFTGREDILSELEVYFKQSSSNKHEQLRYVLYGLGGAGKTQIMRKLCANYGNRFSDIYLIDASSRASIEQALKAIAHNAQGIEMTISSALTWFCYQKAEWLMIFDNADDPA
ncbi:hypothetical protein H0H92_008307, partial [Tricholoma furcatifolium]